MHKNTTLRYVIIGLLFAIPFISLVVVQSLFFPYISGKNFAFRTLVDIAAMLYVILAIREPKYRPKITATTLAFTSFIVVLFFADIFGINSYKSFFSNYERMEGFFTHLHLFFYFIILGSMLNTEKLWKWFLHTSLAVSVVMGVYGMVQLAQGVARIDAQLGNSTYLGAFMLFNIFIALFLMIRTIKSPTFSKITKTTWIVVYSLVILFDFYIFYHTGTRGALLGLLAGTIFASVAFAIFEKRSKFLKYSGIGVLVLIVLVVSSLAIFKNSSYVKNHNLLSRFASLATFDKAGIEEFATTQGKARFTIWEIALKGFKERPILGWGQDNFNYVFNKYYDPKMYDQEQWFDRAHDVFFDWLIAGGILGLLSYLSLFAACVLSIWRSKSSEENKVGMDPVHSRFFSFSDKVVLSALLIAYFIHNIFVFDNISSYILFFTILAFVHFHEKKTYFPNLWNNAANKPVSETYFYGISGVAVVLGLASIYYLTVAPYLAGRTLITALVDNNIAFSQGNGQALDASYNAFQKVFTYNTFGSAEAREQLLFASTNIVFSSFPTNDQKLKFFTSANDQMIKQINAAPNDARYYLFYGSFLAPISQAVPTVKLDDALKYLNKAHELSPGKQPILMEIGSVYIDAKQYAQAIPPLKQAYDLYPDNNDARFIYALGLIYNNDGATADQILAPLANTPYMGDLRLIKAYYDNKAMDKVLVALKFKLDLALKYANAGDKADAITQIQEIISVNPSFKTQGEALMAQIQGATSTVPAR